MNISTNHKLNVTMPAGFSGGARAAALLPLEGAAEFTDGSLAARCLR